MSMQPKTPKDLMLAPVAASIDLNLQRLRGKPPKEIGMQLVLEFDKPFDESSRSEREVQVLRQALRDVELHGWDASVTDDASSVRLSGGSVSLDIGLSAAVMQYIVGTA